MERALRHSLWHRALLFALFVLLITMLLPLAAGPAVAHSQLISSSPAENAALESAPTEIVLLYSDSVLTIGAVVLLVDTSGTNWAADDPLLDGSTVTALVEGDLPDGTYEIRWRVVSIDGHPISGIVPFSVGDGEPALNAPLPQPKITSPTTAESSSADGEERDSSSAFSRVALVGLGGAGVALLVLWLISALTRRRRLRLNHSSEHPAP